MTHKVITVEIIAFDGFEAEGINDALASILEREEWRLYSWTTDDATAAQAEWFRTSESTFLEEEERRNREAAVQQRGRPAPHFDPRIDYPERYTDGPI
jgi:hypothetical protein